VALVAKTGTPSLSDVLPPANDRLSEKLAGVAIAAGDLCRLHSDDTIRLCNGTAADALALYDGVALKAAGVGEAVTLGHGIIMRYGAGLTPGARYYASATPGALEDAATTGGTVPVAKAVSATEIYFFHPNR
jgi:hypothetical protein